MEAASLATIESILLAYGPLGVLAVAAIYLFRENKVERGRNESALAELDGRHRAEREALQRQLAELVREHKQEIAAMVDRITEDNREQIEFNRTVIDRVSAMTESLERKYGERRR